MCYVLRGVCCGAAQRERTEWSINTQGFVGGCPSLHAGRHLHDNRPASVPLCGASAAVYAHPPLPTPGSQIIYAFIMMPHTLPASYVRFIRKQGAKELYVWQGVRVSRVSRA